MMILKQFRRALFTLIFSLASLCAYAQQPPSSMQDILGSEIGKTGKDYASIGIVSNEFRSVTVPLVELEEENGVLTGDEILQANIFGAKAHTYSLMATYGTYITDHFKTELRFGGGIRNDDIKKALELNIRYWFNWYIGTTYPVTDYLNAYALYGLSHYAATVIRRETPLEVANQGAFAVGSSIVDVIPSFQDMEEDLFGTSFSTSWVLGFDYRLSYDKFLAFEYGRLLRDDDSNIKVRQASIAFRYEF